MASGTVAPSNASSSCRMDRSALSQVATSVSICLILGLGALLNGLALWVFGCRLRRRTETCVYMVNLVAADCLLLLSLPGVLFTLDPVGGARGHPVPCAAELLLRQHLHEHQPHRRHRRGPLCRPALPLVRPGLALPPAGGHHLCGPLAAGHGGCGSIGNLAAQRGELLLRGGQTRDPRSLVFSLFLFFLPLLVLSFCSVQVLQHLLRKWTRTQPQAAATIRKAICVVAANLATFVLCFLPLHVALLAKLVAQWVDTTCHTMQMVTTWVKVASRIANANCHLDAVGYYFVASEFQEEVGAVLTLPWPFQGWSCGSSQGQPAEESQAGRGSPQPLEETILCTPGLP
ncbi:G-protein coupled receptor 35-like [Elephas maximus indicus]|uniref:G-protein coupled receptor 35-like n=1 Tax=Elephas maximus indicus TaxID=99487 RepID=UPI00211703B0|nr:G-protein coupled receptor 35-like [Elephas maximus indicus]